MKLSIPGHGWLLAVTICLLSHFGEAKAATQKTVTPEPNISQVSLTGNVAVLHDPEGKLTIDDVRSAGIADQFVNALTATISNGFTKDVYWYRIHLRQQEAQTSDWVLEMQYPWLDFVDFYVASSTGGIQSIASGDWRHSTDQLLAHRTFALPLHLTPNEQC